MASDRDDYLDERLRGVFYRRTIAYSGSFPYLNIAERYGVPYRWVLNAAEEFDKMSDATEVKGPTAWFTATFIAWTKERDRRKATL